MELVKAYIKVMFKSINAVEFFENLWGFISYWGTNERECVLFHVSFSKKTNQFQVTISCSLIVRAT